ncbi:MAG: class I SAM-dependent methyltransferase, partial [Sulfolobaceae archaeon]
LKEIFSAIDRYSNEARVISDTIGKTLGNRYKYALSERKRLILYSIVKHLDPEVVIETGVGPGASTTMILFALNRGRLYSIDVRKNLEGGEPVGFLVPDSLKHKWKLYIGKSRDVLPTLLGGEIRHVDLFLHDSEHTIENILFELNIVWDYLREGGIVLIDNLNFTVAPYIFAREKRIEIYELDEEVGGLGIIIKGESRK